MKFLDTGYVTSVRAEHLRNGSIRDPMIKVMFGVGYIGVGRFVSVENGKSTKLYHIWRGMLSRVYGEEVDAAYSDVTVCPRWHNYQNFCEDIIKMDNWDGEGFDLDKDWRLPGNREYSPKACSFVPRSINTILTSPYNKLGHKTKGWHAVASNKGTVKYAALVTEYGKQRSLGLFNTKSEASKAYIAAKESYVREQASNYKEVLHKQVYNNLRKFDVRGWMDTGLVCVK